MAETLNDQRIDFEKLETSKEDHMFGGPRLTFTRPVLVFLPCFNCGKKIVQVLSEIPASLHGRIECLVIDNNSTDDTCEQVLQVMSEGRFPFKISLVRNKTNYGYAGSQKLAMSLATQSPAVQQVMVLHGDGQYHPEHLSKFIPYLDKDFCGRQWPPQPARLRQKRRDASYDVLCYPHLKQV